MAEFFPTPMKIPGQIILFGDSITQQAYANNGFASLLSNYYIRKRDIINRGFSGFNTDWCLPLLTDAVKSLPISNEKSYADPKLELITVFLGANDACIETSPQHVPLDRFEKNLNDMIKIIKTNAFDAKIVLITPPPVDEGRMDKPLQRFLATTEKYKNVVINVGAINKIPVLDVWRLFSSHDMRDTLSDGLHLTEFGNKLVFQGLIDIIASNWPDQKTENIKEAVLPWREYIANDELR